MTNPCIPYIPAGPVGQPRPAAPATPELDKRSEIINSDVHKGLVAFLEWLGTEQAGGLTLARYRQGTYHPVFDSEYNRVLASYYGLDADKIASEQDALLAYLREINSQ